MTENTTQPKAAPGPAFTQRYVDAGGVRVRYLEAGQGEPLVCIHGAGGLRQSPMHQMLAGRYHVFAFEIPGFGESAQAEPPATIADLAVTMWRAADALGVANPSLMGQGVGASLVLWMALLRPDAIKAIVLLAPMTFGGDRPPPLDAPIGERMALLYAHPERHSPPPAPASAVAAKQREIVQSLLGRPGDSEFEARLLELKLPVLALFGTRDKLSPPEDAHLYREKLPDCNLMFIYDAAHAIGEDRPEAACSVVSDFLARQDQFLVTTESALINP